MNFVSSFLNSVPLVGQGKALIHYAMHDREAGNRALYESTRSSALIVGGVLGSAAGPMGAAALATYAGGMVDCCTSIISDEPIGVVRGMVDITTDISNGEIPVRSVLTTTLQVGVDCVSGIGAGGLVSAAASAYETATVNAVKNTGKDVIVQNILATSVGKTATISAVKNSGRDVIVKKLIQVAGTGVVKEASQHAVLNAAKSYYLEASTGPYHKRHTSQNKSSPKSTSNTSSSNQNTSHETKESTPSASGSGSGPPRRNISNKVHYISIPSEFKILLESLIQGLSTEMKRMVSAIFEGLSIAQMNYLAKIISQINKNSCLEQILKIVIKTLTTYFSESLNFPDFISFIEFVSQYFQEEVDRVIFQLRQLNPQLTYRRRIVEAKMEVVNNPNIVINIRNKYLEIKNEIESETAPPKELSSNFRNIAAAIYHYFKHRKVSDQKILSVSEYYACIRKLLLLVQNQSTYLNLKNGENLEHEVYDEDYQRWIKIVIKKQNNKIILATVYFVDLSPRDANIDD